MSKLSNNQNLTTSTETKNGCNDGDAVRSSGKLILKFDQFENNYQRAQLEQLNLNRSIHDIVNELFELVNIHSYAFNQISGKLQSVTTKSSLLNFLMRSIETMTSKTPAQICPNDSMTTITVLFLQLLRKYFNADELKSFQSALANILKHTKNNKILNELLNIWSDPNIQIESIKELILPILKKNLTNPDYRVRCKCIRILAFHFSDHEKLTDKKIVRLLFNFSDDQDPRVRMTALELLTILHINGTTISVDFYEMLKLLLNDDFHHVRLLSTQLVFLLGFTYPEFLLHFENNVDEERIRLVDDVFSKICCMINDSSIEVRVCANSLLGKLDSVSARYLVQTLDKKLMSDLKVRKFQKLRQKQLISSEWTSTVPTVSSDALISEEDNLNLMASGACGAFIHGLEDEFLEVRAESVESLCSLALNCPKLAAKSIDFLVDMFNDEIEMVRLKAILALKQITHFVLLGDDQIDIVLSVIEDGSLEIREALKDLISSCKLATKIGLKKTIQALFNNLKKYNSDKLSIWKCFKNLGRNHSKFVLSLVSYLVSLHPFIDVMEPDINDQYYISSLILIYNGVNENSAIIPLLPKYIVNHYFFLKLKLPDMIPNIKFIENSSGMSSDATSGKRGVEIDRFYVQIKENLNFSVLMNNFGDNTIQMLQSISSDIFYLSEIDSTLSVACDIMKSFIECYLVIKKNKVDYFSQKKESNKLLQIEEAISISLKLLMLYSGYNQNEQITIIQLYLYLRAVYLKELFNRKSALTCSSQNSTQFSYLKANAIKPDLIKDCQSYFALIVFFHSKFDNKLSKTLISIINDLPNEANQLSSIDLITKYICESFDLDLLLLTNKPTDYLKRTLQLVEPQENLESPIRFMPGLITTIRIKAILNNFVRFDNLFIQICYSDSDKQFIPIETNSIKALDRNKHILDECIHLTNLSTTDSFYVKICISMLVDEYTDLREKISETSASYLKKPFVEKKIKMVNFNSIDLTNQVKIYLEPLLAKKFI